MSIAGTICNGVVVFDEPLAIPLPEGTRVQVVVAPVEDMPAPEGGPTLRNLLKLAGKATGLPPDMAEQHDHYIHGTPRR